MAKALQPIAPGTLARWIGPEIENMDAAAQRRLGERARFTRALRAYLTATSPDYGQKRPMFERTVAELNRALGMGVSVRTADRWCRRFERGGARALVDRRGRPPGGMRVSVAALARFGRFLAAGSTKKQAHRDTLAWARRRGLVWPASTRTLDRLIHGGEIDLESLAAGPEQPDDPRSYLKVINPN